jgi:signal transduction histidine kinase
MQTLPSIVLDYLDGLTLRRLDPAYLALWRDGRVAQVGGALRSYGLETIAPGDLATGLVPFLAGLLPLGSEPMELLCVRTESGRSADVHLFAGPAEDWVVLLDATREEERQGLVQQSRNELSLLQDLRARAGSASTSGPNFARILAALDVAVFEPEPDGMLRALGEPPPWLSHLVQADALGLVRLSCHEGRFPYLESFLEEARKVWNDPFAEPLRSETWCESGPDGTELYLQAAALLADTRPTLILELARISHAEQQSLLQRGREILLSYDRFVQEVQKKEILLHCIVHDLAGPLTSMRVCLEMLEDEGLGIDARRQMLEIGLRQARNQEKLIRDILDAFAAEMAALGAPVLDRARAPDLAACACEVVEGLRPAFTQRRLQLDLVLDGSGDRDFRVFAERSHLERVLSNLVENALSHAPAGTAVEVRVEERGPSLRAAVEDAGPGVPESLEPSLFQKFGRSSRGKGKVGLGLYFCRITVERWGGAIGYERRAEGGSRFWFELPRPSGPA